MSTNLLSFAGKTAIITGASSGIGRATAVLFKELGASLLVTGRNEQNLQSLVKELSLIPTKSDVHYVVADLEKEDQVSSIIASFKKHFDSLDVLVNNAGILEGGSVETTSLESYDRVMTVNLRSVLQLTQLSVPLLERTKGSVVNVSSVNAIRSFAGILAYNISKAGLDQFTRCTALELAPKGIRVNSVNPGVTVTELHSRSGMDTEAYQKFLERSKETHPLGRPGTANEVARSIAFLASPLSSFSTGISLPVDGGRHAACPR
ncbi:unnamed protein product [Bursaphelenchus xylophilus]|uniref:(pine wood nematode) hypothetical protein n=1 Tax=Bursaphelenchus xylophilus TaxID=6326 RepID=A0A1I7RSG0_BURXY|nr:unnamed protein product [Bursaphelenchus xylophilus]CAG9122977.1 unnamed protein product [Bursaphelenchus xylophilus]